MLPILATCCHQKLPSSPDLMLVGLAEGWAARRSGLTQAGPGEGAAGGEPQRVGRAGWGPVIVPGHHLPALLSPPRGAWVPPLTGQYTEDKPRTRAHDGCPLTTGPARCPAWRLQGMSTWLSGAAWGAVYPSVWGLRVFWWEAAGAEGGCSQSSVGGTLAARWVCDLPTSSLDVPLWRMGFGVPCSRPHRRGRLRPGPGLALVHRGH